jgi:hypothetical protein
MQCAFDVMTAFVILVRLHTSCRRGYSWRIRLMSCCSLQNKKSRQSTAGCWQRQFVRSTGCNFFSWAAIFNLELQIKHACVQIALLVGILYSCIGIFQLSFLANFLSHSVISGFTTGAACIIGLNQVKYILGVKMPSGETALKTFIELIKVIPETQWREFLMGFVWLVVLLGLKNV